MPTGSRRNATGSTTNPIWKEAANVLWVETSLLRLFLGHNNGARHCIYKGTPFELLLSGHQHSFFHSKMKLTSVAVLLSAQFVVGARLAARQQDNCARNNCYNAVWSNGDVDVVRAVVDCEKYLTTTELHYPV